MAGYSDQFDFPNDQTQDHPPISSTLTPSITTQPNRSHVYTDQPPQPASTPHNNEIYYFKSNRLAILSRQAHVNKDRAILLNALLIACGLLQNIHIKESRPATIEELRQYHADTQYLAALANYQLFSSRQRAQYGLD